MLIALAILLGLGLAFLLLPVLIALRVEHPGSAGALNLRLSWGFLLGGAGMQLRLVGRAWHLHPLVLGHALPFPRLRLGGQVDEEGVPPPSTPPPTTAAAPPPAEAGAPAVSQPAPPPIAAQAPAVGQPAAPPAKAEAPAVGRATPPSRTPGWADLAELFREWLRPGWRLLRRLAGTFHLRQLRLEGRFGLADPATTGQLFGYLQAIRGVLPRRLRLDLSPDFIHQGVRGTAYLAIHFNLGKALYLLVLSAARLAWRWWGRRRSARRSGAAAKTPSTWR